MWEALKAELVPLSLPSSSTSLDPQDVEIVKEALSCLRSWVLVFQIEKDSSLRFLDTTGDFLRLILQDGLVEDLITCLKNDTESGGHAEPAIEDRGKHQAEAAGRVLAESAQASRSSCFLICKQVLTRVMTATGLMVDEKSPTNQELRLIWSVIGLDVVLQIVIAAKSLAENVFLEYGQAAATTSKKWLDPLREQSENLIRAFYQAITKKRSNVSSVHGGNFLARTMSYFLQPLIASDLLKTRIFVVLNSIILWNFCCSTTETHHFEDFRCLYSFFWIPSPYYTISRVPQIQHQTTLSVVMTGWYLSLPHLPIFFCGFTTVPVFVTLNQVL